MYNYEVRKVTKSIPVSVKCDICGKVLSTEEFNETGHTVSAQHYGWGNDSIESLENKDTCSAKCYIKALTDFLEEFKEDSDTAEIDKKPYAFIEDLIELINVE
jgi:hypothetical protein